MITGLFAGFLANAIGWNGVAVAWGAALVAWLLRSGAAKLPDLPIVQETKPTLKEQTVRINVVSADGRAGEFINFGIDNDRLRVFAEGLMAGRGFTSREWSGGGGLFSQVEFARLRGELIRRNLAQWGGRDPRGGCVLTAKGRAVMRGLAAPYSTLDPRLVSKDPP